MSEFDSPWKEALDNFLRWFLEFFFPDIAADIDWDRGYESLDKELQQIVREAETGKRLADKLFKVWRKNGQESWLLIHVEVQAQPDPEMPERIYVYNYRIYDRFRRPVASLVVLADESAGWRPQEFRSEIWDCAASLRFRAVKLLDYSEDLAELEANPNPFSLIVLAHLQSQSTRKDAAERRIWKVRLIKRLLDRGMPPEEVRQFFRFIDWVLALPEDLELQFYREIQDYTKEKRMPYISTLERWAMEKGREQGRDISLDGIALALELKFGADGANLMPAVRQIDDLEKLRSLLQAIRVAESLDEVKHVIANGETKTD